MRSFVCVPALNRRLQATLAATGLACAAAGLCTPAAAANFDCVMNPALTVKLGSPVPSVISEVLVDRGDRVKKGQAVALMESSVEKAAVAVSETRAASNTEIDSAQATLDLKSGILKRKTDLAAHNIGFGSAQDLEIAQADYNVAKQDLLKAQLIKKMAELTLDHDRAGLELRTIRSPLDGVVVERTLGPGEYVRPEASIMTLAAVDPLNVEAYLPVRYFGDIKVGDTAVVHPDQPVGGDHEAKVTIVDQVFDAASGTFGVRSALPNPDFSLPGGLRCHIAFDFPEKATKFETSTATGNRGTADSAPSAPRKAD